LGPWARALTGPRRGAKGIGGEGNGKGFAFPAYYYKVYVTKLPQQGPGESLGQKQFWYILTWKNTMMAIMFRVLWVGLRDHS